jgi:hypothetical protein
MNSISGMAEDQPLAFKVHFSALFSFGYHSYEMGQLPTCGPRVYIMLVAIE